jgi:hypothetical protein
MQNEPPPRAIQPRPSEPLGSLLRGRDPRAPLHSCNSLAAGRKRAAFVDLRGRIKAAIPEFGGAAASPGAHRDGAQGHGARAGLEIVSSGVRQKGRGGRVSTLKTPTNSAAPMIDHTTGKGSRPIETLKISGR